MKIGTELYFNEPGFEASLRKWKDLLLSINKALEYFHSICRVKATQEDFDCMHSGKMDDIRKSYLDSVYDQLKRSKLTMGGIVESSLKEADLQMDVLQERINAFKEKQNFLNNLLSGVTGEIDFTYVTIVNGMATLTEENTERIRKIFCTTIENENQVKLCELAENFKKGYQEIRTFCSEHSGQLLEDHIDIIGPAAIFYEQCGQMYFNDEVIKRIS